MKKMMSSRRHFLKQSATVFAAGILTSRSMSALSTSSTGHKHPVRIGAPTFFSEDDPQAWAKNAREQRYRAVYAPNVSLEDVDRVRAFRESAEQHDLVIAEVGRWCNLMDANPQKRKENLDLVAEGLALADELNARCCVDIAGTFDTETWFGPHPKNVTEEFFDLAVENARKIIDQVKPKRAAFAYEIMGWAIPDTAENYLRLLKAIDRPKFGVHVDICNMINAPEKFWNTTDLIDKTFDMLGPWIVSSHAKDLRWQTEMNLHFVECPLGEGVLDYASMLKRLASLPNDVPLMIEHMKDHQEYMKCRDYLFRIASEAKIPLEYVH